MTDIPFLDIAAMILDFLSYQVFYSTLMLLAILIILQCFPRRQPLLVMGLFVLVLLRLVLPVDLALDYSARYFLDTWIGQGEVLSAHVDDGVSIAQLPGEQIAAFAIGGTASAAGAEQTSFFYRFPWLTLLLFAFWITGAVLSTALFVRQWWRFRIQISAAEPILDPAITTMLRRWQSHFSVKRTIRLVTSDQYLSPFTMGIFRPVIFLPKSLLEANDKSLIEPILAHEVVHLRHMDTIWMRLQNLLQIVYFFHPVVWLVVRRINEARESYCDQAVLRTRRISLKQYTASIVAVLRMNLTGMPDMETQPGFGHRHNQLTKRLQHIKKGGAFMKKPSGFGMVITLLVFALFLLPMSSACSQNGQSTPAEPAAEQPEVVEVPAPEENDTPSTKEASADLRFESPIAKGYSSSEYGMRMHPLLKKEQFHKGIDIAAPKGTPVYAASSGIVRFADENGGYGNMINIEHALGYISRYGQLSEILVKTGQKVKRGEMIARVGSSGLSTAPHLHFEIYPGENKQPIDPRDLISDLPGKKHHK